MALPTSPQQPKKPTPPVAPPVAPQRPTGGLPTAPKPSGLPVKPMLPTQPLPNHADVSEEQLAAAPKKEYLKDFDEKERGKKRREFNINEKDQGVYHALSKDIGSEEILNQDYDVKFKHLEPVIVQTLEWVHDTLNERNMSGEVAKAREYRGKYLAEMQNKIDKLLLRYFDSTPSLEITPANYGTVSAFVINEVLGLGPIEPLWEDSRITEIMVNGPSEVRVEIGGKIIIAKGAKFRDKEHLIDTVNRILQPLNKSLDNSHPEADGRLYDGSRLHALHPAVVPSGPVITIRRFPETVFDVETMVNFGAMTEDIASLVGWLIHSGCSTIVAGGTGSGKALALDTLIPTPSGMTTMGKLKVGDKVLDENSLPCNVVGVFPQPLNSCFRVEFSDGSHVIADEEHNWLTHTRSNPELKISAEAEVRTTREIYSSLKTYNGLPNHSVKLISQAVQYAEVALPEDPRSLGERLAKEGLKDSELFSDDYLYSSVSQREELLAGLLDQIGYINTTTGAVCFDGVDNETLRKLRQIIHSLGHQTSVFESEGIATVSFSSLNLSFSSPKTQKLYESLRGRIESRENWDNYRYIVDVVPVDPVPTACITVDSPNSLYLFSDAFIVTHNTSMLNALSGCIPLNERIISIEDNLELRLNPNRHWVPLETRVSAHGDKTADKDIRSLVRASLRMRPDRIVVGEVRDEAAYDMLQAMNTGHEGSMTTVHANDPPSTVTRLINLVTQSKEMDSLQAASLIANSVDLFVNIARYEDGSRRISHISEIPSIIEDHNVGLVPIPLWEFRQTGVESYTDDKGRVLERVVGEYVQVNEVSDALIKRHRLDYKPRLTAQEVYAMSSQEGKVIAVDDSKPSSPVKNEEVVEQVSVQPATPVAEPVAPVVAETATPEPVEDFVDPLGESEATPQQEAHVELPTAPNERRSRHAETEEPSEGSPKASVFLTELMKMAEEQDVQPPKH